MHSSKTGKETSGWALTRASSASARTHSQLSPRRTPPAPRTMDHSTWMTRDERGRRTPKVVCYGDAERRSDGSLTQGCREMSSIRSQVAKANCGLVGNEAD